MSAYAAYVWGYFKARLGNEYGVAGMMGNLRAESGMYPDRLQGDIPYSSKSKTYTKQVDSGAISKNDFVHNGPNGGGYGLCQWTYYTRKQGLYEMWKSGNYKSIGSIELACEYLYHELKNDYKSLLSTLMSATSVREASDAFLHDFERPADQSESVEISRAKMGQTYYNTYKGTTGTSDFTENDFIIHQAIEWITSIANDDSHGYDQDHRHGPDYDCSSLVCTAYNKAGIDISTSTTTKYMRERFQALGFIEIAFSRDMEYLRGDILWREGHTEMYIGDGKRCGAHINEVGGITGGKPGDQTGDEISIKNMSYDWEYILRLPSSGNPYIEKNKFRLLMFAIATDRFWE